jgi:hypothetical protein
VLILARAVVGLSGKKHHFAQHIRCVAFPTRDSPENAVKAAGRQRFCSKKTVGQGGVTNNRRFYTKNSGKKGRQEKTE